MPVKFADPFDEKLARIGPSALFTQTHEGLLQFDLFRTREWRRRFCTEDDVVTNTSFCHCVCIDRTTQWPLYVLLTSKALVASDDRTKTTQYSSMKEALLKVAELKRALFTSTV